MSCCRVKKAEVVQNENLWGLPLSVGRKQEKSSLAAHIVSWMTKISKPRVQKIESEP